MAKWLNKIKLKVSLWILNWQIKLLDNEMRAKADKITRDRNLNADDILSTEVNRKIYSGLLIAKQKARRAIKNGTDPTSLDLVDLATNETEEELRTRVILQNNYKVPDFSEDPQKYYEQYRYNRRLESAVNHNKASARLKMLRNIQALKIGGSPEELKTAVLEWNALYGEEFGRLTIE